MITEEQAAFLRERLTEDWRAADGLMFACRDPRRSPDFGACGGPAAEEFWGRFDAARALREVEAWRKILLDYLTAGLDAKYAGTERETGFRLALSFALKCKAMAYKEHPDYGRLFG